MNWQLKSCERKSQKTPLVTVIHWWIPHEENNCGIPEQLGGRSPLPVSPCAWPPTDCRIVIDWPDRKNKRVGSEKPIEMLPFPIPNLKLQRKDERFIPISRCWLSCVGWPSCIRVFPGSEFGLNRVTHPSLGTCHLLVHEANPSKLTAGSVNSSCSAKHPLPPLPSPWLMALSVPKSLVLVALPSGSSSKFAILIKLSYRAWNWSAGHIFFSFQPEFVCWVIAALQLRMSNSFFRATIINA